MTMTQWFIFFLILQVIHALGTWKLYVKAGRKAWEAAVPVYNAVVLMKIIKRPWWWVLLLFIPIINLIMFPVIWVETARSFGRNSTQDTWLTVLTLGLYLYYINYALDVTYNAERSLKPRSSSGEWVSSILFAVVAATFVHTYFIQPFVIPTPSLEKSLLVGDFLFVSKLHYGARTPMTTVAFPMVHDTIPVVKTKSYLNKPQLPYFRFPGFEKIKRTDIVVFNWPTDTVQYFRDKSQISVNKPIDKKSNYVKRCVGIPGDSLEIIDGYIHVNGNRLELPERAKPQYSYTVQTTGGGSLNQQFLYQRFGVTEPAYSHGNGIYTILLTEEAATRLKNNPNVGMVQRNVFPKDRPNPEIFPHSQDFDYNLDQYGPIYIPEAGKTVDLNLKVLPFYRRIIETYEHNTLEIKGNQIIINGQPATSYTFKQNYYWMMGDNRHNSEDSRYWGYVPEDHIVGKPVFIWFSWDNNGDGIMNKIRWDRVFTTVSGEGERVSYFKYFVILMAGWFIYSEYKKRKKKA